MDAQTNRDLTWPESPPAEKILVQADRTHFAETYEKAILQLDKLTPHQQQMLASCRTDADVHIKAAAGAGKTFIGVHRLLEVLEQDRHRDGKILFVGKSVALNYMVARWIRERKGASAHSLLERLHLLVPPFEDGPRTIKLNERKCLIDLELAAKEHVPDQYLLVVVDEAHHLYGQPAMRATVESHVKAGTRRLLLSDISQSLGLHIQYPDGLHDVRLTQVVRSSQRIVAGANAFRCWSAPSGREGVGDEMPDCQHGSLGPPLKPFLFEKPTDEKLAARRLAEETVAAVRHVLETFPGLQLHDRVAIVVPDERCKSELEDELQLLLSDLLRSHGGGLRLVNAEEATRSFSRSAPSRPRPDPQWLVLDTVDNVDGLERLIVIAVNLDAPIKEGSFSTLETRSRLYRALTRAHMM
eukprot:897100-Prymnesium_polylepis.1